MIICPICNTDLVYSTKEVKCSNQHNFPIKNNIIDLSPTIQDEYLKNEEQHFDKYATTGKMSISRNAFFVKQHLEDLDRVLKRCLYQIWPDIQKRNVKIAEIGCGDGSGIQRLKNIPFSKVDYVGADISLKIMEKFNIKPKNWKIQFVRTDVNTCPFKHEFYDIVIIIGALHHLRMTSIMKWIPKVLKKNGLLILDEPSSKNPFANIGRKFLKDFHTENEKPISINDIKKLAIDNNLQLIYEKGFDFLSGPGQYLFGTINNKSISTILYYISRSFDKLVKSPQYNYHFLQIYEK